MAATKQNYTIEQGQTLQFPLLVQIPGIVFPVLGDVALLSTTLNNVSPALISTVTAGMSITGPGIQANTIVTVVNTGTNQLTISQPATASNLQATLNVGASVGVNLTGASLLFSAKLNKSLPDTDPTAVEFNWTETSTPLLGMTTFTLLATTTENMQFSPPPPSGPTPYFYQIWVTGAAGLPATTPVLEGLISVTQPVSNRQT